MTDASAPFEPQPESTEPRPKEIAPETRLEPSPAPEVGPIELPVIASTPISGGEPFGHGVEGAHPPTARASSVGSAPTPRAHVDESATSAPPPRARVVEVEATTLSAGEARALSSEAPRAEAVVITPAPSIVAAATAASAKAAAGPVIATGSAAGGADASQGVPPPPPPATPDAGEAAGRSAAQGSVPPSPPPAPPVSPWRRRRQHVWSILCHLFLFLTIPTVFLGATLTFLVWQLKGRDSREVEQNGREALNFQINVALVTVLLGLTCVGTPLLPIVWLVAAVYAVIAARAASDGGTYRYPYVLRIVSH